jgi:integrase
LVSLSSLRTLPSSAFTSETLVCPPTPVKSTLINPSNLHRRSLAPLLQRAGLPQIRFHDLRHTCATLLLSRNVHPKYVQELLGHATVAITLDTYSHMIPAMGNHTARAMEYVFS